MVAALTLTVVDVVVGSVGSSRRSNSGCWWCHCSHLTMSISLRRRHPCRADPPTLAGTGSGGGSVVVVATNSTVDITNTTATPAVDTACDRMLL